MSFDLLLKPSCSGCGSTTNLYGSDCKHMTLCSSCGRTMARNGATCYDCGTPITRLIREYNVRASHSNDKNYSIARFVSGLPNFAKKKNAENRWSAHKEGLQGRQVTDTLREKYKNKPWLLEDETGQSQYHGHLEGSQSATYYLLMSVSQGKEFIAIPAGSWYNFNKVAQYKQLTLEEAEEKMKNRKKTADGYERWMMKAATTGPAAFGEVVKLDDKESGGGGRGRKKAGDDDEGNASDKGDEDEEDGSSRKSKLRGGDDDDDEAPRGRDPDMDDEEEEKGDDWEHDERFSDDDERVDVDEEREDLANEAVPPEIKDDEDEEDEGNEEGGGLSQSGKELKKLLGKASGLNESEGEDDDDDDDMDDDVGGNGMPPLPVPKQKDVPKEEPLEDTPTKAAPTPTKGVSPASKTSKGKRKLNSDDAKPSSNAPSTKKVKNDPEAKSSSGKDGPLRGGGSASKSTPSSTSDSRGAATSAATATGAVTEEEIKSLLMQKTPITTQVLVGKFKDRLRSKEDKALFADILRRISKIQKTNGSNFVVLR